MALTNKLSAIGDAIREKTGKTELLTLDAMPLEIASIETGGGGGEDISDLLLLTGDCSYKFQYGSWNDFLYKFEDRIKTDNITKASRLFSENQEIEEIKFDINLSKTEETDMDYMFYKTYNLKSIPKLSGRIGNLNYLFSNARSLREIPDGDFDYTDRIDNLNNETCVFEKCYSLRELPMSYIKEVGKNPYYPYSFNNCYTLNKIIGIPINNNFAYTSNRFSNTFSSVARCKDITFALDNDMPYITQWKSQVIDLSSYVGFALSVSYFTGYNSGITADKEVKNNATYQALKDDPDWFSLNMDYSRYNHDSAVNTINSLPDTSAYLATAGGTNTIKFKGAAGAKTDGGAINTMTAEEIAVATAKGWTVTLS